MRQGHWANTEFPGLSPELLMAETRSGEGNRGSRDYVRWLQRSLNQILGLRLAEDGMMGPQTRSAVRRFQQSRGLTVDGVVGPRTEAALQATLRRGKSSNGGRGARCEVLFGFGFDSDRLKPQHRRQIAALARRIAADRAVHIRVIGHTDPVGNDAYNLDLGRRRAVQAASALRHSLDQLRTGLGRRLNLTVHSRGEREPIPGDAARSRRVEICYAPACGVPQRTVLSELALEAEVEELEHETVRATVRTRLCLFQNSSNSSHRNHFRCGALRQARRIGAFAVPTTAGCARRVGATAYDTGADVIAAVERVHRCLGRPVDTVHIFGHSSSNGLFGTTLGRAGLYKTGTSGIDRSDGARTVTDIPTKSLAPNVVFILHGCNQAADSDNFARDLYRHLAASLANPRVYGHYNGGCASRNNSWREYSKRHPTGRNVSSAAGYTSVGCC